MRQPHFRAIEFCLPATWAWSLLRATLPGQPGSSISIVLWEEVRAVSKLFISYRREHTADVCGRLYDKFAPGFVGRVVR